MLGKKYYRLLVKDNAQENISIVLSFYYPAGKVKNY